MKEYHYEDVNKGIEKVMDYLKSIENVWNEMRNLKLYDAFFEAEKLLDDYPLVKEEENDYSKVFHMFCDSAYANFEDWIKEEGINDSRKYIRRTSSFYLTDIHDRNQLFVFYNALDAAYGWTNLSFSLKDGKVCMDKYETDESCTEQEYIQEAQDEMKYFADGECLSDIKKYFEDPVKEAEYIDSFKENQVEYFKEWLQNWEDFLEYEKEEETRRQYEIDLATMACYI